MRAAVVASVLFAATPAWADRTVETELRALADPDPLDASRPGVHATAYAQLVGGNASSPDARVSEGSLSIGGDFHYAHPRCNIFDLGGSARLGYDASTHASAEQWASVCVPAGHVSAFELSHHLEWDVRASLLSPLELRPGLNRRETVGIHWAPLRGKLGPVLAGIQAGEAAKEHIEVTDPIDPDNPKLPQGDLTVFDTRIEISALWSATRTPTSRWTVESIPVGYIHEHRAPWGEERDYTLDFFAAGGDFIDEGATVHLWILRIQNLGIGGVLTSAGIGFASSDAGPFIGEYERPVQVTAPRALLGLETGNRRLHGFVRATHDTAVQADGFVTLDSRVAAGLAWTHSPRFRMELDGAIARTEVSVPGEPATTITRPTGGAALSMVRHLPHRLAASAQVDVARSFYAQPDATFDTAVGVTAFGALQATVGR